MKKFCSVLMVIFMLASTCSIIAFAAVPASDAIAPLRYEFCESCSNGKVCFVEKRKTAGPYGTDIFRDCIHGDSRAKDAKMQTYYIETYECDTCDYGYALTSVEYSWKCLSTFVE